MSGDRHRGTLAVILASATLTVMAGAIIGPVVRQIQLGVGVSESLAGLIITTHGALIVVVSPIAGTIIDRVGPRRPYVFGLFLYGIGGGAGVFVDSFGPLLLSRVVLGVGVAFVYTGITVLLYTLYEGQRMDRALGLRSSANSAGAAVWPLVGGALGTLSWQAPFAVYLVAIPLGLAAIAAIPETGHGGRPGDDRSRLERLQAFFGVFRRVPAIPAVYLLYFGANLLLYAIVVFYPQLLAELGVTSTGLVGLYLAVNGAAGGVSAVLYDRLLGALDRHALVLGAFALWIGGLGAAAVVSTRLTAFVPVVMFGLGLGLVFPSSFAWIEALAPPDRQGSLSSYIASAGYLGQFAAPVVFGAVLSVAGLRSVFAAAALAALGGFAALGLALARRDRSAAGAA
ncbi:MFS transporter [Halapricum desulfuricans]|uniref:MFS family permease n=1 Tax=Halapricum desulfuricans TaxID=2841257 RepID=A0A897N4T9_9EURY|nr:MFS transporter [Halapricum desulfuricans]QSG07258.1 MFS family permease [Halapricum desulfuricans]